jgi:lysozyme
MTKIIGTDVSHWQDNKLTSILIDFAKMKAAGASFAFIKSSQATFTDSRFVTSWRDSKAAGLPRGAYHYLDWTKPALDQANYFCDLLLQNGPGDLPPVCDYEERKGIPHAGRARSELKVFLERVTSRLGVKPVIYTAPSYWAEFGSADQYWAQYDLWIAHYTTAAQPITPKPWKMWHFWQFTDREDGIKFGAESKQIDMNYWHGTAEQLREYAGVGAPEPPEPPEPPVSEWNLALDAAIAEMQKLKR